MSKKNSYTKEELLSCGRGEMFGPGNAQLPLPPMLMFDRIVAITDEGGEYGNGQIIAELDVNKDLWFFGCHFEGDPVMPGCLGLDAMWQLVGFYLGWKGGLGRGRALGGGEIKFTGQVLPTAKKITYVIDLKSVIMRNSLWVLLMLKCQSMAERFTMLKICVSVYLRVLTIFDRYLMGGDA